VRDILWGASEIDADTYEDDPRSSEILHFDKDTTHFPQGIIAHNDEIVWPLKLKARAESLKGVNESETNNERVATERRERLRGLKEEGRHHGTIG
jgi:hypothetical protein